MVNPVKVIKGLLEAEDALADFIRNGPADGIGGYVRDRYRHRCNEFANLPPWAKALSGITGGSIKRFCTPYWDDNSWDGPELAPPPFTGGQCQVRYIIRLTRRNATTGVPDANNPITIAGNFPGPLAFEQDTFNVTCNAPNVLYGARRIRSLDTGNSVSLTGQGCTAFDPFISVAVERVDGQPDDCGDIPTEPEPGPNPPPNPGPLPGPEPTDNPDPENPIPFFPIPPFDDPVFGPQPITGPSDDFDPTPPPNPTAGGDGLPGDGGAIGGSAGEVSGDDEGEEIDFGPPPEGRIWVGCIVDITVDSRIGNIPGTGPQSTVWPSVRGNVALKYSTLFGSSQRINSRYTELFRPNTALTVTGCFLQVQPGGTGIVFPISALTCPETPCGE